MFLLLSAVAFGVAVLVDWPRANRRLPPISNRAIGNFACSCGFLFYVLAQLT